MTVKFLVIAQALHYQWASTEVILDLPPLGHLLMFGNISGCHSFGGEGVAPSVQRPRLQLMHKNSLTKTEFSDPKCQ